MRVCLSDKYRRGALLLVDEARLDETSPEHLLEKLARLEASTMGLFDRHEIPDHCRAFIDPTAGISSVQTIMGAKADPTVINAITKLESGVGSIGRTDFPRGNHHSGAALQRRFG